MKRITKKLPGVIAVRAPELGVLDTAPITHALHLGVAIELMDASLHTRRVPHTQVVVS